MNANDPDCYSIKCKFLYEEYDKDGYAVMTYCKKLDHELENGYAIKAHSAACGEIRKE